MQPQHLRKLIQWHREYRPEWDGDPERYVAHDLVGWGGAAASACCDLDATKRT